ncbi:MAG: M13 family metallopeptidase [Bdellovibrionales bacterium]|nr:M13 family metallopeptidase [Bdellovibrionales bacterium]
MTEFKAIMTDFFKLAGYANAAERAEWVAKFETDYINNYPTPAERRPLWTKRKYSSKREFKRLKNLELAAILNKIPKKTKIRNPMDKVFKFLDKAMATYTLDQLKSAYLFQSTSGYLDEAYPEYFKRGFAFRNKFLGGAPKRTELTERCTQDVMSKFTKEIDAELFDKFFPNFPEKKFVSLLEKVRGSILEGLQNNKWLTKKAKANAIKKIKMAKFQVVKPKTEKEWDFNPKATYNAKTYIGNKKILAQNLTAREFDRLGKPVDKTVWYMGPLTVNAYYSPTSNKFVMPAGILQYPFYDPKLPDWVNLGAVGAVVGHELGHGVDDQGSKYDERGKVRQWMTGKDVKTFKKRGEKLIAQFEKAGHNGKLTLGENIGDLVGVTFALNAAQKVMPKDPIGRERATKDFFLQYARAWCGVIRPKRAEMQLKTDPHSLVWARVNEQMKHQGEFAKVYKCKAGDKLFMPEADRVRIW